MAEKKKEISFEENLKNLEMIVKELESGSIPLDDAINKFNEAMKIAKECNDKLKSAEESINKILEEDGTLKSWTPDE